MNTLFQHSEKLELSSASSLFDGAEKCAQKWEDFGQDNSIGGGTK